MDHFFPNFFTRCNVPFVTLRSDKAEWPVLQLTTLPEKHKHLWRKTRSHPRVVGFDSSPSIRQVGSQLQSRHCQKNGGPHVPTVVFCPDVMGCSRRSLSSNSESFASTSCWGHLPPGSHFRDRIRRVVLSRGSQNRQVQRLRPVGVMKTSSSVPSRRLREFTLLIPASWCTRSERHRCWFCPSLAPTPP